MGIYPYYEDNLETILEIVNRFKMKAIIRRKEKWWSTYDDEFILPIIKQSELIKQFGEYVGL